MPLIQPSSYKAPFLLGNRHIQTILPSYFRKADNSVTYDRETFIAPDKEPFLLDWARVPEGKSDKLLIISHGLCGHTRRHYALSMVKAFNTIGWDCLAWNYRGTGPSPVNSTHFTTNDSSDHLKWVTEHAILKGKYKKVALVGYSMGGNLCMLYLTREAATLPSEIVGSALFCAAIDLKDCAEKFQAFPGSIYCAHFMKKLVKVALDIHEKLPDQVNINGIEKVKSTFEYDDLITAPLLGLKDAITYYQKASACFMLDKLNIPTLMVNPKNDPFLGGGCFPLETARNSKTLFLETPDSGGHCGFITLGHEEWWPTKRAKEFLVPLAQ
ncbi:MAG: alpha/beta fold hydrolase [Victivallales bacterium]|nr:alpha/beta fold hydrolase [Victivallales bacterium]